MNHFIRITSQGGYFGRIVWRNTGPHHENRSQTWWGETLFFPSVFNSWPGELLAFRIFTHEIVE